jgi:putative transposase
MKTSPDPHYRHRFPAEIISHAVWLYHVFSLCLRDVELILAQRGVLVSYETVRRWCQKFGESFAQGLRRQRPRPGDKWHLDEVFIRIQGETHYLWRAVDQHGVVLDVLVQRRRDGKSRQTLFQAIAEGPAVCAACDRNRQIEKLRGGQARRVAERRAPAEPLPQQSG